MTGSLQQFLRHLRDVVEDAPSTDGEHLEAFIRHRSEAAFAALVHRHGPMVHGVCQRITGNVHDAEDAFQATFLVLARKADSIVPHRHAVFFYPIGAALKISAPQKEQLRIALKQHQQRVAGFRQQPIANRFQKNQQSYRAFWDKIYWILTPLQRRAYDVLAGPPVQP